MKTNSLTGFVLCCMFIFFGTHVVAAEEALPIEPFIKKEFYKQNITLEELQSDVRGKFRHEAAFDQLTKYVGGEVGKSLSGAEFTALLNDNSQVQVRNCLAGEKIKTGAIQGDQFHWFWRSCRSGEQIIQVKLGDRWIDVISLNCLNAVEDQTPVPAPVLTPPQVVEVSDGTNCDLVPAGETWNPGVSTSVQAVFLQGCTNLFVPGINVNTPASVSSKSRWVCK